MAYFLTFFVILALSFGSPAHAAKTYTVKKGDSLYEIADKFDVSVSSLKEKNRLSSSGIKPGAKLLIPGKEKTGEKAGKTEKKEAPSVKAEKEKATEGVYHTVRKKETLEKIAKKYSISQKELKELNNLRKDRLKLGQRLLVKREEIGEVKAEKTQKNTVSEQPEAVTYYLVRKGDTLKKIARKFGTEVAALKELNGLKKDSLSKGQRIIVSRREKEADTVIVDAPLTVMHAGPSLASFYRDEERDIEPVTEKEDLSKMSIPDRLILFAKKMLHLPYRFGGNSNFGIDCSAYVKKAYGLVGLNIPRSAREQFKVGEEVEKEELTVGDLVFFRTYASFPSHVGIYLGNNLFIHASSRAKKVTIDRLDAPYYVKRFIGAKRLLTEEKIPMLERELFRLKN
ncbi:MAG: LysM peptidoglycan-binding domain-containing protein [Thermodesulfovibrionales bacterium]